MISLLDFDSNTAEGLHVNLAIKPGHVE